MTRWKWWFAVLLLPASGLAGWWWWQSGADERFARRVADQVELAEAEFAAFPREIGPWVRQQAPQMEQRRANQLLAIESVYRHRETAVEAKLILVFGRSRMVRTYSPAYNQLRQKVLRLDSDRRVIEASPHRLFTARAKEFRDGAQRPVSVMWSWHLDRRWQVSEDFEELRAIQRAQGKHATGFQMILIVDDDRHTPLDDAELRETIAEFLPPIDAWIDRIAATSRRSGTPLPDNAHGSTSPTSRDRGKRVGAIGRWIPISCDRAMESIHGAIGGVRHGGGRLHSRSDRGVIDAACQQAFGKGLIEAVR